MMVEVKLTPQLHRVVNVASEKELEDVFVEQLKKNGWVVERQKKTIEGNRIDVLARYPTSNDYFIFELKYFEAIHDYTKAFKQIFDKYYKKNLVWGNGVSTSLVALITPRSLYRKGWDYLASMIIERFFWRMGFGIGSLEDFTVSFTSQGQDAIINLAKPSDSYRTLEQKINIIKERQHWND